MMNVHVRTAVIISTLQSASWFCNKYVLTELGFKYPMVFQGWQTLVGFLVLRLWTSSFLPMSLRLKKAITPMDKPGFVSLFPFFLFFTASLITGSKAISSLSITEFAVASNFVPAGIFLISERKNFCIQQAASAIVAASSLILGAYGFFFLSPNISEGFYSPYFWLLIHIVCLLAASLHSRICDARFLAIDRLYYGYVFSFIVLAPASIYLEEAFEALNFQHRRQMGFLLGSLAGGMSGAALNAFLCNGLKPPGGLLVHVGTLVSVVGSWAVFSLGPSLPPWAWILIAANLAMHLLVPTHFSNKDEEDNPQDEDDLDKEVLLA
eukprot:TRINITY_DN4409_c0_g1_i1.p1 TRINITY_DN4409_c0_g1~~TRINITY_DN4409_c0_g1_i1.p1  ORF type:complete len:323 (+),score=89.51 TRINITY_DN4409_c0_g1_i1:152-1120(+)